MDANERVRALLTAANDRRWGADFTNFCHSQPRMNHNAPRTRRWGFGSGLQLPHPSFRLLSNDDIDPNYQVACRAHRGDATEAVAHRTGWPRSITVDHGTEFVSKAVEAWTYYRSVRPDFARPGKPTDNGHIAGPALATLRRGLRTLSTARRDVVRHGSVRQSRWLCALPDLNHSG